MKLYFDQRQAEKINVFVTFDDAYYGKVVATKGDVTGIEVPDSVKKVRLSFTDIFDGSDELPNIKLEKGITKEIPKREKALDEIERRWQYAYDVEVDLTLYDEDLLFYPVNFKKEGLKGGIYYRGSLLFSGLHIEQKLIKRVESFGIAECRKKRLIISLVATIVFAIAFPYSVYFFFNEYLPNKAIYDMQSPYNQMSYFGNMIISFVALMMSITDLSHAHFSDGMYKEEQMEPEYYLKADEYV